MSSEPNQNREVLTQRVRSSLKKADEFVKGRKKINTGLLVTGMTSSAAATLIAGITAAGGPVIGSGTEGWRLACILAAVFGFASTLSTGLNQQLKASDLIVEGTQCARKLRSLELGISTGSKNWEEVSKDYEEIINNFPGFIS